MVELTLYVGKNIALTKWHLVELALICVNDRGMTIARTKWYLVELALRGVILYRRNDYCMDEMVLGRIGSDVNITGGIAIARTNMVRGRVGNEWCNIMGDLTIAWTKWYLVELTLNGLRGMITFRI